MNTQAYVVERSRTLEQILMSVETMKAESEGRDIVIVRGDAVYRSPRTETVDQLRYRLLHNPENLMRPRLTDVGHRANTGDIVEVITNEFDTGVFSGEKGVVTWASKTGRSLSVQFGGTARAYEGEAVGNLRHYAR